MRDRLRLAARKSRRYRRSAEQPASCGAGDRCCHPQCALQRGAHQVQLLGTLIHLVDGWLFAFLYVAAFESWHRSNWALGGGIGLIHGAVVLIVAMPLIPAVHPRMVSEYSGPTPNRQLQPPGFLALNYGRRTPLVTMLAHLTYGVILGSFYHLAHP